jgi:hypothetical protein
MRILFFSVSVCLLFTSYSFGSFITTKTDYGSFNVFNRSSSTVLAAPHGTYDINTGVIVSNVCNNVNFSCVVATGFMPKGKRININRPTEGVGIKSTEEQKTIRATIAFTSFKEHVSNVAKPNLQLYIEVHGAGVDGIEVATHNISKKEAKLIKIILKEEWSKHNSNLIPIKVQGVDKIKMVGNGVKNFGIVADLQPKFIAFEFSRALRNKPSIISKFLTGSINRINSVL